MKYAIIGAGCFGLYSAMYIKEYDPNAEITIYDNNINLSSTVKGGNGMFYAPFKFGVPSISIRHKNMYKSNIYIHSVDILWGYISMINGIFNNKKNRQLIVDISVNKDNYCDNKTTPSGSSFYDNDYWFNNINILKTKGVIFSDKYINDYNEISFDRLIIATNNTKFINYSHILQPISGLGIIMKVKNMPDCFYYNDFIFVTPYDKKNNLVNITTHIEVGYNKGNYNIDKNSDEYNNIIEMLRNNKEVQKLEMIDVINIWCGVRMNTYDMLPFYSKIKDNIYIITGGSFLGTNTSNKHAKWMVESMYNIKSTDIPNGYDPTINRLLRIRRKYIITTIILIILIIIFLLRKKLKFIYYNK